jgi:hypothetical protein
MENVSAPTLNFRQLQAMFLRKDFDLNSEDIKEFE